RSGGRRMPRAGHTSRIVEPLGAATRWPSTTTSTGGAAGRAGAAGGRLGGGGGLNQIGSGFIARSPRSPVERSLTRRRLTPSARARKRTRRASPDRDL